MVLTFDPWCYFCVCHIIWQKGDYPGEPNLIEHPSKAEFSPAGGRKGSEKDLKYKEWTCGLKMEWVM